MHIKLRSHWDALVKEAVDSGRFASADDVVDEGLRLFEERDRRLKALQAGVAEAVAEDGEVSEEELDAALATKAAKLRARGVGV